MGQVPFNNTIIIICTPVCSEHQYEKVGLLVIESFFFPTGKVIHAMVAHLDAVTCLTTDPKGSYLISGSE